MSRLPLMACVLAIVATVVVVAGATGGNGRSGGDATTAGSGGRPFVRSVPGDRAVVWAVGDGTADDNSKAVARRIARGPVDRLLYLGDVYEDGTAEEFARNYAPSYGRLARKTAPTAGNHDDGNATTGYDPYWRRAHGGVTPPDWYSFRAGGWTIISLDSQVAHGEGSPQLRWLERRVRRAGTCRIAFWHRPRYSAGKTHGDQEDMEPVVDALRGRTAIVLTGHEHDMQRFKPIDGITHFVSGAGGRGRYELNDDSRLAFGDDQRFGALRLRLSRGLARFAFVAAAGQVLDSGSVRCRPGA
jgi:predicted phosphodiesterase